MRMEAKVNKLHHARLVLYDQIAPDVVVVDEVPVVLPSPGPVRRGGMYFKKQDFTTFNGERQNYPMFKRI